MKASLSGNAWSSVWTGEKYTKKTSEYEDGRWKAVTATFRQYPNIGTSIQDHSLYLIGARNGDASRYAGVAGEKDPRKAITIIKTGGYATDPEYVEKVMSVINKYDLDQYDDVEETNMEINQLLTQYNHTSGTADRIKYIVIHYVGATGGAKANCQYYAGGNRGASAHYFVDFDGSIWQSVEDQNVAWHCGAKSYVHPECRNANSIGIEMCVRNNGSQADTSRDWYFEDATVQAAIQLTKYLMGKYGIDPDHVVRHYDVTGKICPNPYVYNHTKHTWNDFKAALKQQKYEIGWHHDTTGWWYADTESSYYKSCWQIINHHKYYFNSDGYAVTNWQQIDGKWYYFESTEGHDLECALYVTDQNGVQFPGEF
jgi:N-acetyl-anhydromuramyl-L-alanine amidase AmpD